MKYIRPFIVMTSLMLFTINLYAQQSHTITIRVLESNYKKWSKIVVSDKLKTIEVIDIAPSLVDPSKQEDVMLLMTQVLDKYTSEGYKIATSNGGPSAQIFITTFVLIKEDK